MTRKEIISMFDTANLNDDVDVSFIREDVEYDVRGIRVFTNPDGEQSAEVELVIT